VTSGSGMDPPSEVCARIGVAPPSPAERSLPLFLPFGRLTGDVR